MNDKILWDIIDGLRDDIRQLHADAKHDMDVCYDVDDEHVKIIKALEEQVNDLMIDKDRLIKQVSSNRGNNSSTHTHTISKEIDDYMHHNPDSMGARLFILPRDEFNDGEYDSTIYWEDGME